MEELEAVRLMRSQREYETFPDDDVVAKVKQLTGGEGDNKSSRKYGSITDHRGESGLLGEQGQVNFHLKTGSFTSCEISVIVNTISAIISFWALQD